MLSVIMTPESNAFHRRLAGCLGCVLVFGMPGWGMAAEPGLEEADLPRVPPTEPGDAPNTFEARPGFRMERVASEPLVMDPIAMAFDEEGRLFVVEMRGYSERRDDRLGRIRRLEDTDGDGIFDRATVYVDGLPWPTAVICHDGGVFVGCTPDILYCKDTDDDGQADVREVVFTGFANDFMQDSARRLNVQAMMNSFTWGLDNRIHGASGGSGGRVVSARHPEAPAVDLRGRDFSFDPRTLTIRAETGGAQHGLGFDDAGRKFVSSNSDHLQLVMYDQRVADRESAGSLPPARLSIAEDGPAAPVYRISPDEPWRVIRTRWRVAGLVGGPIEGGGRPSGYFTGATGATIFRGDGWPEEYLGSAFIADCGSNLIHRKRLWPEGAALVGRRAADEQEREFVASTDNWFRPVQFANAPDGMLYVADMYREVIEHPWSLPASIKQHLDLNSGSNRGRIYRIVPESHRQRPSRHPGGLDTEGLVAMLEHPNGWHRDTASRLLYERQDAGAVTALRRLAGASRFALGRMHALYALEGLEALGTEDVEARLDDEDARVRLHAVRLAGEVLSRQGTFSRRLADRLMGMGNDSSIGVRYELAFVLGNLRHPRRVEALAEIARSGPEDRWLRAAVLSSVGEDVAELFRRLAEDQSGAGLAGTMPVVENLAERLAAGGEEGEMTAAVETALGLPDSPSRLAVGRALVEGLRRAGRSPRIEGDAEGLEELLREAAAVASDEGQAPEMRADAIVLLGGGPFDAADKVLSSLLAAAEEPSIARACVLTLLSFDAPAAEERLFGHWSALEPGIRREAVAALLRNRRGTESLLTRVERGAVSVSDFTVGQINALRSHASAGIAARGRRLFGKPPAASRGDVVERYLPALRMEGDVERGRELFGERCAQCHRAGGMGIDLGPDLSTIRDAGRERLLVGILDPNREVPPQYAGYVIETERGELHSGVIVGEGAGSVTLRSAGGVNLTIERSRIRTLTASGMSLMPEGLEAGMTVQAMADLLEFLAVAE
ncbi:MAG TPA: PVC-type heme-binding CxxCH protein [Methylomirabilota bacterium]|nr:PVC-type heme-binding CxxCH protein [Methylomirabilota bacterium]